MKTYLEMNQEELYKEYEAVRKEYENYTANPLALNMTRGKPSPEQLKLTIPILDTLTSKDCLMSEDGTDCSNFGVVDGIPEAKRLFAELLEVKPENMIICGNSSLNIMYDTVCRSYTHGVMGSTPFCRLPKVKWLCVVPGYDRHFRITEHFGFEMINIPMLPTGPDMDMVEKLVSEDDTIKGIWCVPKYSNPTGNTYSAETVYRFAALKPAAPDFRIYWDNAYCVHHLYNGTIDTIPEILTECEKAGNPDMVYEFTSTSKISIPGAGIAVFASSPANIADMKKKLSIQTIGHDKINQLRHVKYFKNVDGITSQMKRIAEVMRPKYELVDQILTKEIGGLSIGTWTKPNGGYFISFDSLPGCAKAIVAAAKAAGMQLTDAGSAFPYKKDPKDTNIRIAPSYPDLDEITEAMKLFVICVKVVSLKKLLGRER